MKKIKNFFNLFFKNKRTALLLIEAYLFLGWARFLIFLPFSKLAPSLGEHMQETSYGLNRADAAAVKNVRDAIQIMSRYTFWESKCLVRAIAAMKMLQRRGIDSTLYLGTARNNAELSAHAWLRSGPLYITGADSMREFTVVGKFAKRISNSEGENGGL